MARHNPDAVGITLARLDGAARRLLHAKADRDTCIAELHAISDDPMLLGQAAGTALGAWLHGNHDGDRVANMLTAAGGDETVRERLAVEVETRLQGQSPRRPRPT